MNLSSISYSQTNLIGVSPVIPFLPVGGPPAEATSLRGDLYEGNPWGGALSTNAQLGNLLRSVVTGLIGALTGGGGAPSPEGMGPAHHGRGGGPRRHRGSEHGCAPGRDLDGRLKPRLNWCPPPQPPAPAAPSLGAVAQQQVNTNVGNVVNNITVNQGSPGRAIVVNGQMGFDLGNGQRILTQAGMPGVLVQNSPYPDGKVPTDIEGRPAVTVDGNGLKVTQKDLGLA